MTNKQALQAYIGYPIKSDSIDLALINASVTPDEIYTVDNQEKVETALAGLLLIMLTNPKSISELDFSLTTADVSAISELRSVLIIRWGLPDELATERSYIQDATHFWGTTNY